MGDTRKIIEALDRSRKPIHEQRQIIEVQESKPVPLEVGRTPFNLEIAFYNDEVQTCEIAFYNKTNGEYRGRMVIDSLGALNAFLTNCIAGSLPEELLTEESEEKFVISCKKTK